MKIKSIIVENYRQFEKVELNFDDGITILAGANNTGKTSLISLIKNIFVDEKNNYNVFDIPANNIDRWIKWAYPIFYNFFDLQRTINDIDQEITNVIIPKDKEKPLNLIDVTSVKIHISYNPSDDNIIMFADYLMDLDVDKHDFYFLYTYEVKRSLFVEILKREFLKFKDRFEEVIKCKSELSNSTDEKKEKNVEIKVRYLKQMIVNAYVQSIMPTVYFCNQDFNNKYKFDDIKDFRKLFNFHFIKASRPLDDNESDHSHMLSKQMVKMAKMDNRWNELIKNLPDELLKPIQEKEIGKIVRDTSLKSLKDTIVALEQTNGGKSGELMLDMMVTENDISELLQKITIATYNVDGYYLGESSQGLGYSNMIYIHLQLKEYERNLDPLKVNMFFLEEPESHMHPQMQQVFVRYLLDYYQNRFQGLITTHSNEIVRVAGVSRLRVIRHIENYRSELYDLSKLLPKIKSAEQLEDNELADFFNWFFEIGYSEIIFADKAIFYEGDTERLYIRKVITLNKYKKLSQQYIAFIQVGGAHAKNYEQLIRLLNIKSLIITDIDYEKEKITPNDINNSTTSNATIKYFYSLSKQSSNPSILNLYNWVKDRGNTIDNLIYICYQTESDRYARTLEEAMLNKFFSIDVGRYYKKSEWSKMRNDSKLDFSIPNNKNNEKITDDEEICVRDILESTSGAKIDFMYSVIINNYAEKMIPKYIEGGLVWLMEQ